MTPGSSWPLASRAWMRRPPPSEIEPVDDIGRAGNIAALVGALAGAETGGSSLTEVCGWVLGAALAHAVAKTAPARKSEVQIPRCARDDNHCARDDIFL